MKPRRGPDSETVRELRRQITAVILCLDVAVMTTMAWILGASGDSLGRIVEADGYGLVSAGLLYLTLLISPLLDSFPRLPFKQQLFLARRGLGLSSLAFATVHALVSMFGPIGGWAGLGFVDPVTGGGLIVGAGALAILVVLGATAWDGAIHWLGPGRWKRVHRWIYLGAGLVLAHVFLIGPHFYNPTSGWACLTWVFAGVLVVLEAARLDRWLKKRSPQRVPAGPVLVLTLILVVGALSWLARWSLWSVWAIVLIALVLAFPIRMLDRWVLRRFPSVRSFGPGSVVAAMIITSVLVLVVVPSPGARVWSHHHSGSGSEAAP